MEEEPHHFPKPKVFNKQQRVEYERMDEQHHEPLKDGLNASKRPNIGVRKSKAKPSSGRDGNIQNGILILPSWNPRDDPPPGIFLKLFYFSEVVLFFLLYFY